MNCCCLLHVFHRVFLHHVLHHVFHVFHVFHVLHYVFHALRFYHWAHYETAQNIDKLSIKRCKAQE